MLNPPTTKAEAESRRYTQYTGNPNGQPYRPKRCAYELFHDVLSYHISYQCDRKRGHGPGDLYCRKHARMVERETRKKNNTMTKSDRALAYIKAEIDKMDDWLVRVSLRRLLKAADQAAEQDETPTEAPTRKDTPE